MREVTRVAFPKMGTFPFFNVLDLRGIGKRLGISLNGSVGVDWRCVAPLRRRRCATQCTANRPGPIGMRGGRGGVRYGGVRGAGDQTKIDNKPASEDASHGGRISPGNNGDQAMSNYKPAPETTRPTFIGGAQVSSGNHGDRAKINKDSTVKNAPRVPRGARVSPLNSEYGRPCGPANGVRNTLDGSCALKMPLVPMADRDKPNTPLIRQQVLSRDHHGNRMMLKKTY